MPRAPWRPRRAAGRPARRRWAGPLRRGGAFARQVLLVRVGRRGVGGGAAGLARPVLVRPFRARPALGSRPATAVAGAVAQPDLFGAAPERPATRPEVVVPAAVALLPGERTLARRASFAVVNACTLTSLTLGMLAIFLAMRGDVRVAAGCLIVCVAFDGLDGALARRLDVASPFGAQMDSLADMCSFGLAAPVVVYAALTSQIAAPPAALACALVAACAAVRLARFNVSPKDGRFFCGVPTTMAAAVLALAVLVGPPIPAAVQVAGVALIALAMVSTFPYAKVASLVTMPPWLWLAPLVAALVDLRLAFMIIVLGYLASGPVLWLRQRHPA